MATFVTLTVPLEDIIGDDYEPRRTHVWVYTNTPNSMIVVDGTKMRMGGRRWNVTDGVVEIPNLVATDSASNPTAFAYIVQIVYTPKGESEGTKTWTSGEFPLTTSKNLVTISEAFDNLHISPTWQSEVIATVEELTGLTGEDAAIANRVNTVGTASRTAVDARADSRIVTATQANGAIWKVGPTRVNVRNYGVSAANSAATNDAALAALFAAETSGVMIAFPDLGTYNFSAPLPNRSLMNIEGRGRQTVLNWTTGNVMNVTDPTLVQMATFRDLKITNTGTAGHLFNFVGTSGGVIHTLFERCMIHPGVNGASIINAATYNLFGLTMRDCLLHRNVTATVPAFDIVGLAAAGTNNIHISGGEWHSNLCSSTPFFRFDANSPSPFINMTFMNIIGEQNVGGMIHVAGATATRVQNVIDMDVTTSYTDDIFKFTVGSGGSESNAVVIDQAGTYGSAGFSGGKVTLRITGGVGHRVGWIPKNMSQQGAVILPASGVGGVTQHSVAGAEVPPWTPAVATTPYTMNANQHTVLYSASGGTINLPPTSVVMTGQEFRVKAIGGAGCTVSGNGANIDGAATKALAQHASLTVVWDGASSVWRSF